MTHPQELIDAVIYGISDHVVLAESEPDVIALAAIEVVRKWDAAHSPTQDVSDEALENAYQVAFDTSARDTDGVYHIAHRQGLAAVRSALADALGKDKE